MRNSRTYYVRTTGEIVANVSGTDEEPFLAQYSVVEGIYPADKFYILNGEPKEKREMLLEINKANLNIKGIPLNTKANINGTVYEVSDGSLELTRLGSLPIPITLTHTSYMTTEIIL